MRIVQLIIDVVLAIRSSQKIKIVLSAEFTSSRSALNCPCLIFYSKIQHELLDNPPLAIMPWASEGLIRGPIGFGSFSTVGGRMLVIYVHFSPLIKNTCLFYFCSSIPFRDNSNIIK